jgi:hypothetical protein
MTDTPDNKQEPEKTIKPLPFTTETMEEIMKPLEAIVSAVVEITQASQADRQTLLTIQDALGTMYETVMKNSNRLDELEKRLSEMEKQ